MRSEPVFTGSGFRVTPDQKRIDRRAAPPLALGAKASDGEVQGQIIGYVGSTGNASPNAPHLHFSVSRMGPERQWWRGTPINPFLIWRNAKP